MFKCGISVGFEIRDQVYLLNLILTVKLKGRKKSWKIKTNDVPFLVNSPFTL